MVELATFEIAEHKNIVRTMHGLSKHPIYKTWKRMMWRCYSPSATLVHTTCRVWQQWEAGDRRMHPAFWELFRIKSRA